MDGTSSPTVLMIYTAMKVQLLLKENVRALLTARGLDQKDLAFACGYSEGWISHILGDEKRTFSIHDLDTIADFFGYSAYQMLQPGLTKSSERRRGDRRSGSERRIGQAKRQLEAVADNIDAARPVGTRGASHAGPALFDSSTARDIGRLLNEVSRKFSLHLAQVDPRRQNPRTRAAQPKTRRRAGTARGSDPKEG